MQEGLFLNDRSLLHEGAYLHESKKIIIKFKKNDQGLGVTEIVKKNQKGVNKKNTDQGLTVTVIV